MGGAPWSSKGCVDCRRRKIKCDEQRPECGRCLKSGIKCQGWEEFRNFVGAGSLIEASRQKQKINTKPQQNRGCQLESWSVQGSKFPVVVHSAPAMRAQVFASFIQQFFSSSPSSLATTCNFDGSIFHSIGSLANKSQITERALSAIACISLGKANHNTMIINHGLSLYNAAIRQLANMIQRGVYTNDICYTVFLFQTIDTIHAPYGLNSWGTHVAGMNTLLQCYRSKPSNDPIVDIINNHWQKLQIIFTSTGMRLSKAEYSYLMEPTNGDPLLEILQVTVRIGDVESLFLSVLGSSHPNLMDFRAILQKCSLIWDRLMSLQNRGQLGQEPQRSQHTQTDPEILSPDSLFGFAYDFASPSNALLHIIFWVNFVFLQSLIGRTKTLIHQHASSTAEAYASYASLPFEDTEFVHPDNFADKVARAVPYCLQDCIKFSVIKEVVYGLSAISIRYVTTANGEKHRWCVRVLRYIGERGFDVASHMSKLAASKWENELGGMVPLTSLRKGNSPNWNSNPVPLAQALPNSERDVGLSSMYHIDESLDVDGHVDEISS
ncbi:hypothetical protein N7528_007389 [Penicillium herquei]|nr:hypothetical protein N7528_007389 [Penicillium herquei]